MAWPVLPRVRLRWRAFDFGISAEEALAVLVPFATSRLLIIALVALSPAVLARGWFWHPGGVLEKLTQWDSIYYLHIARHGYFSTRETSGTAGFFPCYPLLVRLAAFVFHDFRVAALVVANSCFLVSGFLLHRIVRLDFADRQVADRAVIFLMFSPVSFFFSTAYTEATFLMFALASFLSALRGRWWLAGIFGMCLAATRNVGFFMAVPLFVEHLRQTWNPKRPFAPLFHRHILAIALVPMGLLLFMLLGYVKNGDAFAYTHASAAWGRVVVSPLRTFATVKTIPLFYRWLFVGTLLLAMVLWLFGFVLRLRFSYLIWIALLAATFLISNSLEAIPRYLSVMFPLFIVLSLLTGRFRLGYAPLLACSIALLTICTVLLANGYWMT